MAVQSGIRTTIWILVVVPWFAIGCSEPEFISGVHNDRFETEDAIATQQDAGEIEPLARGQIRLEFAQPVEIPNGQLVLITMKDGRPGVVQISNYDIRQTDHRYPAVLFHGTTSAKDTTSLVGKTIECEMYYQLSPSSMIAMTKPGEYVNLEFRSTGQPKKSLAFSFGPVELIAADDRLIPVIGGRGTPNVQFRRP